MAASPQAVADCQAGDDARDSVFMRRIIQRFFVVVLSLFLAGCLTPLKNEIPLAGGDLSARATKTNETKLVFFNDSDFLMFGIDSTGRINVTLDGKGVAQLNIGRYAQVITSKGRHTIDLVHRDIFHFRSHHVIELNDPDSFLKIYATPVGNAVKLLPVLPPGFVIKFTPVN